jgi:hypothetical protein
MPIDCKGDSGFPCTSKTHLRCRVRCLHMKNICYRGYGTSVVKQNRLLARHDVSCCVEDGLPAY